MKPDLLIIVYEDYSVATIYKGNKTDEQFQKLEKTLTEAPFLPPKTIILTSIAALQGI